MADKIIKLKEINFDFVKITFPNGIFLTIQEEEVQPPPPPRDDNEGDPVDPSPAG